MNVATYSRMSTIKREQIQDSALKSHFETNVWPERAQELLRLTEIDRVEVVKQIEQSLGEIQS